MTELVHSRQRIVHKRTAKTAKALANEVYEALCSGSDSFYAKNRRRSEWVARNWKEFIGYARMAHAKLLESPTLSQADKDELYEVFLIEGGFKGEASRPISGLH